MSKKEQRKFRFEQFWKQHGVCACGCGRRMILVQGSYNSAEIDHKKVQPMGHPKNWAEWNLQLLRHDCNAAKGSRRDYDGGASRER